jgi:hypothetical protein
MVLFPRMAVSFQRPRRYRGQALDVETGVFDTDVSPGIKFSECPIQRLE